MRRPRYVLAFLIGLAWVAFVFFPNDTNAPHQRGLLVLETVFAPLAIALYLAWSWLWGGHRHALAFSPAEAQHLFTAPLSRRTLIHFKLVRSQGAVLFSALLLSLVMEGTRLEWPLRLPSFWLLLTTIQLHQIAASLVHTSAETQGLTGMRRNVIPIVLFLGAVGVLAWSVFAVLPDLGTATGADAFVTALTRAFEQPLSRAVLFPFRLMLGPLFAPDVAAWSQSLLPAIAVLILHYLWVVRTDAAFEEAAAEAGVRRARRRAAAASGARARVGLGEPRRRQPRALLFPLRTGRPATALVWKNLLAFARGLRRNTVFLVLVALPFSLIAFSIWTSAPERAAQGLAALALTAAAAVVLLGPLVIRNDLRQDLARVSLLRTYPLRGRSIIGAEVASAAVVLTCVQLVLVAIALAVSSYAEMAGRGAIPFMLLFGLAVLVLPALNGLALVIQNALALFFPEWMRIGSDSAGGVEFMGQHVLRLTGSLLLLAIGLLGPLLLAAAVALPFMRQLGTWSALPAAAVFMAALWLEVALLIGWLGQAFERLDPVDAGLRG